MHSPTPDCVACTEAKHSESSYEPPLPRQMKPSKLTHMDLWGKYQVTSINHNYYYLLMVDDASRHITIEFLKIKEQVAQRIVNYIAALRNQQKIPCAIHTDRGTEFVNEPLKTWCQAQGIQTQLTALYSPSQNGIAEQMNRTLIELAHVMITAARLPEFLWEPAIAHAIYLRNLSFTRSIPDATPYQLWYGCKPNVAHLCEFRAPVWVLLQGQKVQWKMLLKSEHQVYIRYDEGLKSIKYYNLATRNIPVSRNFRFLSPPEPTPPEEIVIKPRSPLVEEHTPLSQGEREHPLAGPHSPPCEGELRRSTHPATRKATSDNFIRQTPDNFIRQEKRKAEENIDT